MMEQKILSLLGLCQKAGQCQSGEFLCEQALKKGKAKLVVVASDASNNTKNKFKRMCKFYKVEMVELSTKNLLGRSVGKEFRASLVVLNKGFADSIIKQMK